MDEEEQGPLKNKKFGSSYGAIPGGSSSGSSSEVGSRQPLLGDRNGAYEKRVQEEEAGEVAMSWADAVMAGKIQTTWQRETQVLGKSSFPLMISFILQYSLTTASVLSAGNLGKNELAAVSLASMTATITGYCVFQGKMNFNLLPNFGVNSCLCRSCNLTGYSMCTSIWRRQEGVSGSTSSANGFLLVRDIHPHFYCMVSQNIY